MRRLGVLLCALIAACNQAAAGDPLPVGPATTAAPTTTMAPPTTIPPTTATPTTTTAAPVAQTTTTEPPAREFFVFMPSGLDSGLEQAVPDLDGVESFTVLRTGTLHITETRTADGATVDRPPDGFVIPVQARVVDSLDASEVVLGATSALVRRLRAGDEITFEGDITLTVGAVVPDHEVGSSEVIVGAPERFVDANIRSRAALITYAGEADDLEAAVRALLAPDAVVRIGELGGGTSRPGGFVRSQAAIKLQFGEFAYRPSGGGQVIIDPAWVEEHIVTVDIPLLGLTRCHKDFAALLTEVMQSLVDDGLAEVIDPADFAGCWNPRFIAGSTRLSRHAFGVAADINFGNPTDDGPGSPVHPELLARMEAAGIRSGHLWTNPDPGHFEWFGPDG